MKQIEKKNCLFQYATKNQILEDTDLITRSKADKLVEKWREHMTEHWDDFDSPQMVIWVGCDSNTDYHTEGLEIDYRDCELKNGYFYKVKKELII